MTADPNSAPRILFVRALDPLPLIDPTAAARHLKVRRHTLACYRSLGAGPAYYKLGRWIRYTPADLDKWAGLPFAPEMQSPLSTDGRSCPVRLVDSPTAAHFLTVTRYCLENYREIGSGPRPLRLGRRIYYSIDELRHWVAAQRHQGALSN